MAPRPSAGSARATSDERRASEPWVGKGRETVPQESASRQRRQGSQALDTRRHQGKGRWDGAACLCEQLRRLIWFCWSTTAGQPSRQVRLGEMRICSVLHREAVEPFGENLVVVEVDLKVPAGSTRRRPRHRSNALARWTRQQRPPPQDGSSRCRPAPRRAKPERLRAARARLPHSHDDYVDDVPCPAVAAAAGIVRQGPGVLKALLYDAADIRRSPYPP